MQLTNLFGTQEQSMPQQEQAEPSAGMSGKAPVSSSMADSFLCKCEKPPSQCDLVCDPSQRGVDDVVRFHGAAFFDDMVRLPRQSELFNELTTASTSSTANAGPSPRQEASADVAVGGYVAEAEEDTGEQEPTYEGDRVDEQPHGYGTMKYPNGDFYEGQWIGGSRNGEGVFHQAAGQQGGSATTYRGQWRDGLKHGSGVETWSDGTRYEGDFREGEVHGCGAMIFPSGVVRRVVNGALAA